MQMKSDTWKIMFCSNGVDYLDVMNKWSSFFHSNYCFLLSDKISMYWYNVSIDYVTLL